MIRRRTLLMGSAASAALLLACRRAFAEEAASYIIGTLFPMAGPNAEYGAIFTAGAQMALAHLAEDKMLRKPVELRAEDSQATPQGGATGMTKLANVDHAVYTLIGFTGVSKAAAPIGQRNKVVMVNGGGVGPDLSGLAPLFWNVIPLIDKEIAAIIPWLKAQGAKRVAVLYVDDPLGNAALKQISDALPANGGTLAGSFSIAPTAQQFGPIAAKIRESTPDAVYFASYGAQQAQIIKQLRDNGVSQQLVTYSAATIPSVRDLAEAEGLVFTAQLSDWTLQDPVTQRFVKDWREKYHSDPTTYHQNYYNAVRLFGLLAQGLEKAGKPVDGEALRAELLRVRKFALVGGEGTFDDNCNISIPIQINRMKGGKAERIG
ncbi:ABC transporter substrate-binding protein [Aliidongia dinghuensis]|uniref:ABC transporter substrate-binding protein n=1 Tax=Aliidongia dinghuensis TaxID=1867774 RepID=A0A8J2Z1K9_9PROT|nr:ABC transporter substrate-binding protein [Aliidongia dinghuensis]GGF48035.1 ABC transporter substrate-binding protein [Aliidongia dinghuensis]